MRKEISLQNWIRGYWLGMLLALAAVYAFSWYCMSKMLTARAEESIQKSVRIVQRDLEDSLEIMDSFIYESLYSGTTQTPSQLYYSLRHETDPVKLLETQNAVLASIQSIVSWSDMIDFVLVYTGREDFPWLEVGTGNDYRMRREIKHIFEEKIGAGETDDLQRYMVCSYGSGNCMLRLLKLEDSYLILCVSEEKIITMLKSAAYHENAVVYIAEADGQLIVSSEKIGGVFSPEQEGTYVEADGKTCLQTGYVSERSGYYFGILTERGLIFQDMRIFRLLFFLIFLILMILMPALLALMQYYVGKPVKGIAGTMDQIAAGDLDVTVEERSVISELGQLVRAFNHMIARIRQLKIEKYESELEVQKATMQYLQLQIKPHFYANMFNIIYSLAERRDFQTIQRIAKAIVSYSRYMFHDAAELVELRRELLHVRDYMEIQEIRYMQQIAYETEVPEEAYGALVPPFVIQSYVENSVKYAFSSKKNSWISIAARMDAQKEQLTIVIRDNGSGYPKELLESDWKHAGEDGHIGLANVWRRLRLIYGEQTDITLQNDHGAVTTIRVPYIAIDAGMSEEI